MKALNVLVILLSGLYLHAVAQPVPVLFIGNSYTQVNDLPALLQAIALANGDTLVIDSSTPGGHTFQNHTTNATTLAKITSQQWSFVILQEQSQLPSFPPQQVSSQVYPYARALDSLIHAGNPCASTVFYMTWGRKNGDSMNCGSWPPVCTYEGMQARLRESYMEMSQLNNSTVGPVGAAWRYMRSLNPVFDLYQPDESHPSIHGSYLAACALYAALFHKSPVGNTFISTLPQADASAIQAAVHAVVIDSLSLWYQYGDIPVASFSYTSAGNNVQFSNHSSNSTGFIWDFGDGNSSTAASPSHTYAQPGTYNVTLVGDNSCKSDALTVSVTTGTTSFPEVTGNCSINFNSHTGKLLINCFNNLELVKVYDLQGRLIREATVSTENSYMVADCSGLSPGVYIVRATGKNFRWTGKYFVAQ